MKFKIGDCVRLRGVQDGGEGRIASFALGDPCQGRSDRHVLIRTFNPSKFWSSEFWALECDLEPILLFELAAILDEKK